MSDSDINKYPSLTVQQHPTKIAFLIDCDGGLGAAFHRSRTEIIKPELIKYFPANSDIFLFFNSHDRFVVERLKSLEMDNSNVHTFPNLIANSKNGADMNLAFILGSISHKYDKYVIIVRLDKSFEELKQRLENTHPHLKNHVNLERFENSAELAEYVRKFDESRVKSKQNDQAQLCSSDGPVIIAFTPNNRFHRCPLESRQQSSRLYRFRHLLDHLTNQHPEVQYHYCTTCEEMKRKNGRAQHDLFEEHLLNDHRANDVGFRLTIQS